MERYRLLLSAYSQLCQCDDVLIGQGYVHTVVPRLNATDIVHATHPPPCWRGVPQARKQRVDTAIAGNTCHVAPTSPIPNAIDPMPACMHAPLRTVLPGLHRALPNPAPSFLLLSGPPGNG